MDRDERRRLELALNGDSYGCVDFCGDVPRFTWNICPLCVCGLIPIFLVFFSAAFRVDYVNKATVAGAQIINQLGLSYTVYYTAGCWSPEEVDDGTVIGLDGGSDLRGSGDSPPCSTDYGFEIAAAEYDALTGSFLKTKNVTGIRATLIESVKVTPDWRFVTFIGTLPASSARNSASGDSVVGPTLWVVGAAETNTAHATRLLTAEHMLTLDRHCQDHARRVFHPFQDAGEKTAAASSTRTPSTSALKLSLSVTSTSAVPATSLARSTTARPESMFASTSTVTANASAPGRRAATASNIIGLHENFRWLMAASARVTALKHLQVILAPKKASKDGAFSEHESRSASRKGGEYRAAFAYECTATGSAGEVLTYSQMAVIDYKVFGSNATRRWSPLNITGVSSSLHLVDATPTAPNEASAVEAEALAQLTSQACPRFVPSAFGAELLFVAEAVKPLAADMLDQMPQGPARVMPSRRLAVVGIRETIGQAGDDDLADDPDSVSVLPWGDDGVPYAPVHGCPEFVKSLFKKSASFGDSLDFDGTFDSLMTSNKKTSKTDEEVLKASLIQHKQRDTFTFMSDTMGSASVLGVDAQEVAVSLGEGAPRGRVSRAHLLYNVDEVAGSQLRLEGCQPIRAAGRKGHMGFQRVVEKTWATFDIPSEKSHYTAWLACMTADQRIAIVESSKREHWVNMSMPYPQWTGLPTQGMWCRASRGEGCFEVWSNPNPNEDMLEEYFEDY